MLLRIWFTVLLLVIGTAACSSRSDDDVRTGELKAQSAEERQKIEANRARMLERKAMHEARQAARPTKAPKRAGGERRQEAVPGRADSVPASLHYKLAVIDRGGYVDPADPIVLRYQIALNDAVKVSGETATEVADMTVKAQELIRKKGQDGTLLQLMTGVAEIVRESRGGVSFQEGLAAVVTLTGN